MHTGESYITPVQTSRELGNKRTPAVCGGRTGLQLLALAQRMVRPRPASHSNCMRPCSVHVSSRPTTRVNNNSSRTFDDGEEAAAAAVALLADVFCFFILAYRRLLLYCSLGRTIRHT